MESEAREHATVTRSQNAVYVMPHDWTSISQFLAPLIERLDERRREVQLLVITPDVEVAAAISASAARLTEGRDLQIVAATSAQRAARLLRLRPAQIVAGSPATIAELLRAAALKLETVSTVCIAWLDEIVARADSASLETLFTELPKDAARTVVTAELTPAVEELLERYARRARRVVSAPPEGAQPTPIEYVSISPNTRLGALRRILDAVDPASALVFVRDGDSKRDVAEMLRAIGSTDDASVHVGLASAPGTTLVVLYDLPASHEELREAASGAGRVIALIQPRQLGSLRSLAAGGAIKSFTLPESADRARSAEARVRRELRDLLVEGRFGRELLAVEPLLDEFDGSEIAAAALQLLEREREAHRAALAAAPASTTRDSANMVRLFVSVGSRDGARAGDLVGAMANEGGISSSEIGKVDVRESHSIVEASAAVADALIERLNGTAINGRRAIVRRDEGTDRPPRRERSERVERGDRGDRGDRGARGERRPPRPRREGRE
jgi:ATP-dependent RNA helicase DeaD